MTMEISTSRAMQFLLLATSLSASALATGCQSKPAAPAKAKIIEGNHVINDTPKPSATQSSVVVAPVVAPEPAPQETDSNATKTAVAQKPTQKIGLSPTEQKAENTAAAQEDANKIAMAKRIQDFNSGKSLHENEDAGSRVGRLAIGTAEVQQYEPQQQSVSQPQYAPRQHVQQQRIPEVEIAHQPGDVYVITNNPARMQIHMYPNTTFEIWLAGPVGFCPVNLPTSGPEFGVLNHIQRQVELFYENREYPSGNPTIDAKHFNERANQIASSLGTLVALKNQNCVQTLGDGPGVVRPGIDIYIRFGHPHGRRGPGM